MSANPDGLYQASGVRAYLFSYCIICRKSPNSPKEARVSYVSPVWGLIGGLLWPLPELRLWPLPCRMPGPMPGQPIRPMLEPLSCPFLLRLKPEPLWPFLCRPESEFLHLHLLRPAQPGL